MAALAACRPRCLMPALITRNEKPAAVTDHGGLEFVWTTTRFHPGKAYRHAYVRRLAAFFKSRL
jgi:hypothetical protein